MDYWFSDRQMAELRQRLGIESHEPDPTPDQIRAVFAAEQIIGEELAWIETFDREP